MFPVTGLLQALLVLVIITVLYRPPANATFDTTGSTETPTDSNHRRMFVFLCAGTIVWMTDFVYGFNPVVGALLVVSLAFLPSIGTTSVKQVSGDVDYLIIFFLAAVLAIGDTVTYTGFNEWAAVYLLGLGPVEAAFRVSLIFIFFSTIFLTLLMKGLAVAGVLSSVLIQYAEAFGLPMSAVLMTEAMVLNTHFLPYQSTVLIAILTQNVVDATELIRTTIICSVATVVILLPVQFVYFTLFY
jgi:di/tricarboxylate transporter